MEILNGMVLPTDVLNKEKNVGGSEQMLMEIELGKVNVKTSKSENVSSNYFDWKPEDKWRQNENMMQYRIAII